MAETWEQLVQRQLTEYTKQRELHVAEIGTLLRKQEEEIRKQKGITPFLQQKFNKEMEELKTIHKAVENKQYERHSFEQNVNNEEFQEKQALKSIIRGDYQPDKDRDDDRDDYDKE